ncbi:MAG: hypothetical protein KGJ90_06290 [Patescibacteria group bacterium]|nr:hypothetical protein [Patescibacteria group bacterium]
MVRITMEPNTGLEFRLETFLAVRRDGELIAIEEQNGHIIRYMTREATRTDSLQAFGADKVK